MTQLNNSGMRDRLDDLVLNHKIPVIGICVGMQMMANNSDEGSMEGLKWIDATVKKFDETKIQQVTRLPHMGWNDVKPIKDVGLFKGLEENSIFIFFIPIILNAIIMKILWPLQNMAANLLLQHIMKISMGYNSIRKKSPLW